MSLKNATKHLKNNSIVWLITSCRIRSDSQTTGLSLPIADNWIDEDGIIYGLFYTVIMLKGHITT